MNVHELVTASSHFEAQFYATLKEEGCFRDNVPFVPSLSLRIRALAHAALQALYSQFILIPVLVVATISVMKKAPNCPFFSRNESLLARIASACVAATASLFSSSFSSFLIAIFPATLHEKFPSLSQAFSYKNVVKQAITISLFPKLYLLALTLPSLSELDTVQERRLVGPISQELPPSYLSNYSVSISDLDKRAFRWRISLPGILLDKVLQHPETFTSVYQRTNKEFCKAVSDAVMKANVADEQPLPA